VRALIVGSENARGSLAAARALRATGWIVGVGAPQRGLASRSSAVHRTHPVPPPQSDIKAFIKAVNSAIVAGGYEIVFASGDAELLALSKMRKNVRAIVPYAPHERVVEAVDKADLMSAAESAGFAVPPSVETTPGAIESARYPLIIKARLHWSPEKDDAPPRLEAAVADTPEKALEVIERLRQKGADPLVQEVVSGDLLAYTALIGDEGKVIGEVQQRADRVWPPRSGVSVRAVTERVDETLASCAATLLSNLEWFGLAQLQFIATPSGERLLIDLNGRFYGSLSLAIAAGTDLASAWANLATGRPVELHEARPGVRYQWLEGDLRRAMVEQRGSRGQDLRSCIRYARGAAHSVWSWRDPGPALSYVGRLSGRAAKKIGR
jgi:predicted ATP-grasp superfamily ATP-dependent carboligase